MKRSLRKADRAPLPRSAIPRPAVSGDDYPPSEGTDLLEGGATDAVTEAFHALLERLNDQVLEGRDPEGELLRIVRAMAAGSPLEPPTDPTVLPLRRCLLEMLRAELVRQWSEEVEPPDPEDMLEVLQGLERARESLEPNPEDGLAARVGARSGLELVVEVAHDLRSPLTSILFLSETLWRGSDLDEPRRRQLGIIYGAALGLIGMASDMIELAQGGNQLLDTEPTSFSVLEIMDSVRDMVRPMAEEKGLALRILPPEIDQRVGNPVALSRVLLNLTTNALKFTEEGFVEIVARQLGARRIEFSVRDTGCGIDPEDQPTLFSPFRPRSQRRKHRFSGTGLGLTICRRLVAAMGSELQLETRRDWGTRLYFELDLPPAHLL